MEKEFIEYEQSLALKELGFEEPCIAFYFLNREEQSEYESKYKLNKEELIYAEEGGFWYNSNSEEDRISAPLYQQVFRWFREKYNLRGFIGFRPNVKQFDCHVYDMSLSGKEYVKQRTYEEFQKDPKFGTYEEAELECVKELISIVKNKYN